MSSWYIAALLIRMDDCRGTVTHALFLSYLFVLVVRTALFLLNVESYYRTEWSFLLVVLSLLCLIVDLSQQSCFYLQWHTVFPDDGFWKCNSAHAVTSTTDLCLFLMKRRLRTGKSRTSTISFQPCPLRTELSSDSLNLLMILWTLGDEISRFFYFKLRKTFWNCCTIFQHSLS